jgi:hypothetical protein
MREKVRGEYRVYLCYEAEKKGENYAVFTSPLFFFVKFFCYKVIVKQKKKKSLLITTKGGV